ncbi:MAG: ABC transporter ATP-binding protein, partial [Vibrio casei]
PKPQPVESKPKKLSYKLQRELESLPQLLEKLEAEVDELQEKVNQPDFFNQSSDDTQAVLNRLNATEQELETAFARWEELESMQA